MCSKLQGVIQTVVYFLSICCYGFVALHTAKTAVRLRELGCYCFSGMRGVGQVTTSTHKFCSALIAGAHREPMDLLIDAVDE